MSNVDINVDRRTDGRTDGWTDGQKIGHLYRTLLQASAIKNMVSEDSDKTVPMCRLIWIFTGHTSLKGTAFDIVSQLYLWLLMCVCKTLCYQLHAFSYKMAKLRRHITYHNGPQYWDTLSTKHTCPKVWNSPFYYLLMCLKHCCMYGKQCSPWSDAAFCGIWSGPILFAKVYLSQYLGLFFQKLIRWYTPQSQ